MLFKLLFSIFLVPIVRSSCLREYIPFITFGGLEEDPAVHIHESSIPSFEEGFGLCLYYRVKPEFYEPKDNSKYYLMDIDQRVIVYETGVGVNRSVHVQISTQGHQDKISIYEIPEIWTNLCILMGADRRLRVVTRSPFTLEEQNKEYQLETAESILNGRNILLGNASISKKEDGSFPGVVSNMFLCNFGNADMDTSVLSYVHRPTKILALMYFFYDADEYWSVFQDPDSVQEPFIKPKGFEPFFDGQGMRFKGAMVMETRSFQAAFNIFEYNFYAKDPTFAFEKTLVMKVDKLPTKGSGEFLHIVLQLTGIKYYITNEGFIDFNTSRKWGHLSDRPLPAITSSEFELRLLICRIPFSGAGELSVFYNGELYGKTILSDWELYNHGVFTQAYAFKGFIGSFDLDNDLEFTIYKYSCHDGIHPIDNKKSCLNIEETCLTSSLIGDPGVVSCGLCPKDTHSTLLDLYPALNQRCYSTDPNIKSKDLIFRLPFPNYSTFWASCRITDFSNMNCPICHGSCLTCSAPGEENCLSCIDQMDVKFEDNRCVLAKLEFDIKIAKIDDFTITIQASNGLLLIKDINVFFEIEGWTENEDYVLSQMKNMLGGKKKVEIQIYKNIYSKNMTITIYNMKKGLFHSKVIMNDTIKFEFLPDFSPPDLESNHLSAATRGFLQLDLLMATLFPLLGGVFQRLNTIPILLLYPILLPRELSTFIRGFADFNKNDVIATIFITESTLKKQGDFKERLVNKEAEFTPKYLQKRTTKILYRLVLILLLQYFGKYFFEDRNKSIRKIKRVLLLALFSFARSAIQVDVSFDIVYSTYVFKSHPLDWLEISVSILDSAFLIYLHNWYISLFDKLSNLDKLKIHQNKVLESIASSMTAQNKETDNFESYEDWLIENSHTLLQLLTIHLLSNYPKVCMGSLFTLILSRLCSKVHRRHKKKLLFFLEELSCDILLLSTTGLLFIFSFSNLNEFIGMIAVYCIKVEISISLFSALIQNLILLIAWLRSTLMNSKNKVQNTARIAKLEVNKKKIVGKKELRNRPSTYLSNGSRLESLREIQSKIGMAQVEKRKRRFTEDVNKEMCVSLTKKSLVSMTKIKGGLNARKSKVIK